MPEHTFAAAQLMEVARLCIFFVGGTCLLFALVMWGEGRKKR